MTPSQQAKAAGLKSLAALSRQTRIAVSTLKDWHKDKPVQFMILIAGCVALNKINKGGSKDD